MTDTILQKQNKSSQMANFSVAFCMLLQYNNFTEYIVCTSLLREIRMQKTNLKKLIGWCVAIVLLAGVIGTNIYQQRKEKGDHTIRIGVIAPMTGANALMGKQFQRGLELLKKDKNYNISYKLIYADDQMMAANTVTAAKRLIDLNHVDVILTYSSQAAGAIASIAEENKVLHFSGSSDMSLTKKSFNYIMGPTPEDDMKTLFDYLGKKGYKRLALILENDSYVKLVRPYIHQFSKEKGIDIVFEDNVQPSERDFRILLIKAEKTNPDIYLLQAFNPVFDILVRQLNQYAPHKPFTGAYVAGSQSQQPELLENQAFLDVDTTDTDFIKKYDQEYNTKPEQMAVIAYPMLDILLKTIETGVDLKDEIAFQSALKTVNKNNITILGKLRINGRKLNYYPIVQQFKNGKLYPTEK